MRYQLLVIFIMLTLTGQALATPDGHILALRFATNEKYQLLSKSLAACVESKNMANFRQISTQINEFIKLIKAQEITEEEQLYSDIIRAIDYQNIAKLVLLMCDKNIIGTLKNMAYAYAARLEDTSVMLLLIDVGADTSLPIFNNNRSLIDALYDPELREKNEFMQNLIARSRDVEHLRHFVSHRAKKHMLGDAYVALIKKLFDQHPDLEKLFKQNIIYTNLSKTNDNYEDVIKATMFINLFPTEFGNEIKIDHPFVSV